jgi:hypothetical protein
MLHKDIVVIYVIFVQSKSGTREFIRLSYTSATLGPEMMDSD